MLKGKIVLDGIKEEIKIKKNVIGYGTGLKETRGKITDTESILVLVNKKEDIANLKDEDKIPSEIEGIKTDVIIAEFEPLARANYHRPFQQGDEIGADKVGKAGTLGCILRCRGKDYGITNWHVLWDGNEDDIIGVKVTQPGGGSGQIVNGKNNFIIGTVINYLAPSTGMGDAALFEIDIEKTNPIEPELGYDRKGSLWDANMDNAILSAINNKITIPLIGFPHYHKEFNNLLRDYEDRKLGYAKGFTEPLVGKEVYGSSRTTKHTEGIIISTDITTASNYGPGRFYKFENQVLISKKDKNDSSILSSQGDSGKCWLECETDYITSLLFLGSKNLCIATNMRKVLLNLFSKEQLFGYNLEYKSGWNINPDEYNILNV